MKLLLEAGATVDLQNKVEKYFADSCSVCYLGLVLMQSLMFVFRIFHANCVLCWVQNWVGYYLDISVHNVTAQRGRRKDGKSSHCSGVYCLKCCHSHPIWKRVWFPVVREKLPVDTREWSKAVALWMCGVVIGHAPRACSLALSVEKNHDGKLTFSTLRIDMCSHTGRPLYTC